MAVGLSDKPGGRKTHENVTPLLGGVVIIPVFVLSLIVAGLWPDYWVLICAALVLLAMGAIDDVVHINPFVKFTIQVWTACFVVVFGGVEVTTLGDLFGYGEVHLWYISKPFSVMCLVLLMNAMNMIDGLDGLSGGLTGVILFILLLVSWVADAFANVFVLSLILAPIAAFLIYNMRYPGHERASVFMGDAGTLALGLIIGWFTVKYAQGGNAVISPAVVPWIVGLPVVDTFAVYLVRAINGQDPFSPDRRHIHHRLVDAGVPHARATAIILLFSVLVAAAAVMMDDMGVPHVIIFGLWLCWFFIHIALTFRPQPYQALFRHFA